MNNMSKCSTCNQWSSGKHFGDTCLNCIVSFMQNPSPTRVTQSSLSGPTSGPSNPNNTPHPTQIRTIGPSYSTISRRKAAHQDTGTHVFYNGLAKEARAVQKKESLKPKTNTRSSAQPMDPKPTTEKRYVKAGVTLYINDQVQKKVGIVPQTIDIDTKKPNFYDEFRHHLWNLFSDEILTKSGITFPPNPEQYTSLGTGDSKITSHSTLLELARTGKTIKSAPVIHLFYQHPSDDFSTDTMHTQATTRKRKHNVEQTKILTSKSKNWEQRGATATKVMRGSASLSSQVDALSHPVSQSITIKPDGWTAAERLQFFNINDLPPAEALLKSFIINDYIHAITFPFSIQVDTHTNVGQGSSRRSHPAKVRSLENGKEVVNNWVAKERYLDSGPNVSNHATDYITYQAFALILAGFKDLIKNKLAGHLALKGSQIELVRHCVVVVGGVEDPEQVFFFESHLRGTFVKYSSNMNFNVSSNQKGMDSDLLSLMNALTHWSYNQSQGQRLVCDLQGFGPVLTDPQLADLNADSWAEGNSVDEGIQAFLDQHHCTAVCNQLRLGHEGKAIDLKWRKSHSLDKILASRNRDPGGNHDFGGRSNGSHEGDSPEIIS
ncbi:hypothetical protein MJO29_005523 [Puccinia striiformis f. sp. tritici]|nr:hypothetical protein MJO29_005523 [Puccinia striiformis f. sp. tritici]